MLNVLSKFIADKMLALTIERIVCSSLRVGRQTASHQVTGMQDMSKILRSYSIGIFKQLLVHN